MRKFDSPLLQTLDAAILASQATGVPRCQLEQRFGGRGDGQALRFLLHQPHQRGMLIVGEVKIRHSGDMGSRSLRAALYHGFLEQTVARVTVTTLLQRGYSGQRNVRECTGET